ncbi:proline-rich receptor-like protein kinase PERK2 [Haliotis rubra]|uniref:proline-rich receptor-like protein kinase PERK2 n=1 Tax=Haliotis rubra TaxID=36100 RepID=UPI001EE5AAFD|nr:proline-rich receptor-like protein kinase PERK2 [Haliotis rubra]
MSHSSSTPLLSWTLFPRPQAAPPVPLPTRFSPLDPLPSFRLHGSAPTPLSLHPSSHSLTSPPSLSLHLFLPSSHSPHSSFLTPPSSLSRLTPAQSPPLLHSPRPLPNQNTHSAPPSNHYAALTTHLFPQPTPSGSSPPPTTATLTTPSSLARAHSAPPTPAAMLLSLHTSSLARLTPLHAPPTTLSHCTLFPRLDSSGSTHCTHYTTLTAPSSLSLDSLCSTHSNHSALMERLHAKNICDLFMQAWHELESNLAGTRESTKVHLDEFEKDLRSAEEERRM